MREKSHELQWLEIMNRRKGLDKQEVKGYNRLMRGYQGECQFDRICDLFLSKEGKSLNDLTLDVESTITQIDKVIFSEKTVYVIDVKNYRGEYTFSDNEWRVGQRKLSSNILEQLRRSVRIVENIYSESGIQIEVRGVLVFINPDSLVKILDPISEVVLNLNELPGWIMRIRQSPIRTGFKELRALRNYERESYRMDRQCGKERFARLSKGICCQKCGGFDVTETRHTINCPCGHTEVKETAFVRTICEYGLINHHKSIRLSDLSSFMGPQYNRWYTKYILRKHFSINNRKGKSTSYDNKGLAFDGWFKNKRHYFQSIDKRKNW